MANDLENIKGIDFTNKALFPFGRFGINRPVEELPGGSFRPLTSGDISQPTQNLATGVQTPQLPTPSTISIPQLQLTPQESEQSEIIKRLVKESPELARQEFQFRQEQEAGQDITGKTKAIQDLQNQLFQIQGEQVALKAREAAISPSLDVQLQRGGPGAFLTEFTRGRQEEKARRELAIEGLTVSARAATTMALYNAAQGNLATAQSLIDKAVRDKFGAEKAEREARIQNLELLKMDPALDIEQKNRVRQIEAEDKKQEEKRTQNENNFRKNLELANQLIFEGVTDTVLIQRIQEAKDRQGNYSVAEAQRIVAESGLVVKGADLTGTSADLRTFQALNPTLQIGTPEFRTKFNQFVAEQAALTRKPEVKSNTLQRILSGVGSLADLTPSERQSVQDEAFSLGYFNEVPPDWFNKEIQNQLQSSITSEEIKRLWNEFRSPLLATSTSSGITNPFK